MSTNVASKPSDASVSGSGSVSKFDGCVPMEVPSAKVMGKSAVEKAWKHLYTEAGVVSSGESVKTSLRCAVYMYLAKNGTSSSGAYPGVIVSGTGAKLLAAAIPAATGTLEVRQFARANALEALDFFHTTGALQADADMRARCEAFSVRTSDVVGMVDYLDIVVNLTPSEREVQGVMRNYSIERSRRARGGKDTAQVQGDRNDAALRATGPNQAILPPVDNNVW